MKKLSHYCVRVSNVLERNIVTTFYLRATKRAKNRFYPTFAKAGLVGLDETRFVSMNTMGECYPYETILPFTALDTLADTPSRRAALAYAYKKHNPAAAIPKVKVAFIEHGKPVEPVKKTPSKLLPVASFTYPKKNCGWAFSDRKVRIVKLDDRDLIGFDLDDGEKFKRFKVSKIRGSVRLDRFNS